MKFLSRSFVLAGLLCLLGALGARADNYWTNTVGGAFNDPNNWGNGAVPGSSEPTYFTNLAPYTVTFTGDATSGPIQVYDGITFNLSGHVWTVASGTSYIGTNGHPAMTVKFSSSAAGDNYANIGGYDGSSQYIVGDNTTLIVDDSLGYATKVLWACGANLLYGPAPLIVSGNGSEFDLGFPNGNGIYRPVFVTNQATLGFLSGNSPCFIGKYTTTVVNATMKNASSSAAFEVGTGNVRAGVMMTNSVWYDSNTAAPTKVGANSGGADVVLDDHSTYVGQAMQIGSGLDNMASSLQVLNGSSATFSNRLLVTTFTSQTNRLVLNNGTISLGGATAGALTNRGLMRAAGTIRGIGSSPATVYSEKFLEVGSSIGTLTLSNANLELTASSMTTWEFNPDVAGEADLIDITAGTATLLGTNTFVNIGGGSIGYGTWDFLQADSITYTPAYDNLSNLVAGLTMPSDPGFAGWSYGVVDLGDYEVLRLSINMIPEPSTVLLLVGGGLVLYRVRRRK